MQELDEALEGTDALLLPVAPITAYPVGARRTLVRGRVEEVSQAVTRYTPLGSVTGRPAISIPCGLVDRLPVGLQLLGPPGGEATILRLGHAYQARRTGTHGPRSICRPCTRRGDDPAGGRLRRGGRPAERRRRRPARG
jgi:Asp-tRNA(Asn)/Glu-tRNA(Gln) amidotransferase A subunit family amidase